MIKKCRYVSLLVLLCAFVATGASKPLQQTVTLRVPRDPSTGEYDEGRACYSFKYGAAKQESADQWDLGYGFMAINNEDWFILSPGNKNRSVIEELGVMDWSDSIEIPVLRPLPELKEGETRNIEVDTSGDTFKLWKETTRTFAKVRVGNMYLLRVKDEDSDFYILFRVESLQQRDNCTISWKRVPSPEGKK